MNGPQRWLFHPAVPLTPHHEATRILATSVHGDSLPRLTPTPPARPALYPCPYWQLLTPQTAIPVLIGTKYDKFAEMTRDEQEEITKQAKRFSKAMHAPLVSFVEAGVSLRGRYVARLWVEEVNPLHDHRPLLPIECPNDADLLLNVALDQCAENLQDCARKGL